MELAAKAWVVQHNRNRPINRFHIIELRTDKKYGGIIKHEPAFADVSVSRGTQHGEACLIVEIVDVVSVPFHRPAPEPSHVNIPRPNPGMAGRGGLCADRYHL